MIMKEIHFYKDMVEDDSCVKKSHNDTVSAIENGCECVLTYALSALCFERLLEKGYRVYLHENNRFFEIKEGNVEATDKWIEKGHNVLRMWVAGVFDDFFYNDIVSIC